MGLIKDAVNYALAQQGKPYHAYGNRFGPYYYDCSGLMNACLNNTGTPCSATNTVGFYEWGKNAGTLIPVDQAIHTYGAMLIRGRWWGYGPAGHISMSLGDGRTMAAIGSRYGCGISSAYHGYQDGLIVPGADYSVPVPIDWDAIAKLARWKAFVTKHPLHYGVTSGAAGYLNDLLLVKGLEAKHSNTYGKLTRKGVHHLKMAKGFTNTDGTIFGGKAASALLA